MENKLYYKAVSYAHQIITEAPSFKDFSNALIDYAGTDVCPYCKTIYSVIVSKLPSNLFERLDIDVYNDLERYSDTTLMRWYREFRAEQERIESERVMKENIDELFLLVKKYRNTEEFSKMLDFIGKFNYLAPYNAMLVQLQKPSCRFIFTAKKWKDKYNRQPKPNAQNLITLVPFGPVQCMYDFSDTDPIPNAGRAVTEVELMDEWDKSLLRATGRVSRSEMHYLIDNLPAYGVYLDDKFNAANTYGGYIMRYEEGDISVNLSGNNYLDCKSKFIISVNKNQSAECAFHTICHELGHLFCRHQYYVSSKVRRPSLREREFEAETVAWLVCKRHGVDNPSEEYLAGYSRDGIIPMVSLDCVLKAVLEIEKMLSGRVLPKKSLWYKEDRNFKDVVDNACKDSTKIKTKYKIRGLFD